MDSFASDWNGGPLQIGRTATFKSDLGVFYDWNMLKASVMKCNGQVCQSTGQWGVKNEKAIERGFKFLERDPRVMF